MCRVTTVKLGFNKNDESNFDCCSHCQPRITGSTEPGSAHGLDHRIGSLDRIIGPDLSEKNVMIKIIIK